LVLLIGVISHAKLTDTLNTYPMHDLLKKNGRKTTTFIFLKVQQRKKLDPL